MFYGTQYTYRHNQVANYLDWNILRDMKINASKSWLKLKPLEPTSKNGVTVLWDLHIFIDKRVKLNRFVHEICQHR